MPKLPTLFCVRLIYDQKIDLHLRRNCSANQLSSDARLRNDLNCRVGR